MSRILKQGVRKGLETPWRTSGRSTSYSLIGVTKSKWKIKPGLCGQSREDCRDFLFRKEEKGWS